jgi:toxin ParE1/3/4
MMRDTVHITLAAWRDLEEITDRIAEHDSVENAGYVLDRLLEATESVGDLPQRGSRPSELPPGMGVDYRQVFFKPYRIVYKITEDKIVIHLVADGRRNLQSLLMRRLTSG